MAASMRGKHYHNVDSKGRVIIPAKFRESLGKKFVVTMGFEDCLLLYSEEEWEIFTEKLTQLPNKKEAVRDLKRFFRANADDMEVDGQGRALIPLSLRQDVGIEKEVVIIGNGERAEIWPKDAWDAHNAAEKRSKASLKAFLEESDIDW